MCTKTVSVATVAESKTICLCLSVWGRYITADQRGQINSFFRRAYTRGHCLKVYSIEELLESVDYSLFKSMQSNAHCLHSIMPPLKPGSISLRTRGHEFELVRCKFEFFKRSFLPRCLYKFCELFFAFTYLIFLSFINYVMIAFELSYYVVPHVRLLCVNKRHYYYYYYSKLILCTVTLCGSQST